jgi:hypothetical protein
MIGTLLFSILLIRATFFASMQNEKPFYYAAGFILLLQAGLSITDVTSVVLNKDFTDYFTYVLVAVIGTIKLRKLNLQFEIDKLLNVYLIYGIMFVLWEADSWLRHYIFFADLFLFESE